MASKAPVNESLIDDMLVPNMWYGVMESREVPSGKPIGARRLNDDLVFWRDKAGKIVVMRDVCPHRQSKLSPGKIVDGNLQCHFHGFQYDREGACQLVPANGRNGAKPRVFQCRTYHAVEAYGFIWVWYGKPRETYPPIPYFDEYEGFSHATFTRNWSVHYTRAVESLLDVSHLPFVHAETIGRGMKTLVNGPYTTLQNNELRVWVSNQPDTGLPARKPSDVPASNEAADIYLNFPNVWQLRIADQFRQVAILAPVDEGNTVVYVRTYFKLTPYKWLNQIIVNLSTGYNKRVLKEDEYIVLTQTPKKSGLDVGDNFIPGDRPIVLYLLNRRDLIVKAYEEEQAALATQPAIQRGKVAAQSHEAVLELVS